MRIRETANADKGNRYNAGNCTANGDKGTDVADNGTANAGNGTKPIMRIRETDVMHEFERYGPCGSHLGPFNSARQSPSLREEARTPPSVYGALQPRRVVRTAVAA